MVLLSLALFEPAYCMWLCPFKAVTEYVAARNLLGLVQNVIFILLFAGPRHRVALPDKKANPVFLVLSLRRIPIHLQQDQHL